MPPYNLQSLFYDGMRQEINTFGGELSYLSSDSADLSIWKLALDGKGGGTSTHNDTSKDPLSSAGITRPLGGASASNNDTAFYLGGYSSSRSSPATSNLTSFVPTPGLVEFETKIGQWTNKTDTRSLSPSGTFMWGGMESVPFGPHGLMVAFGGETSTSTEYVPGETQNSMSVINLFDPVSKIWYKQAASGPIPSPRLWFCTAGVGDNSPVTGGSSTGTYEIAMYGGFGGQTGPDTAQYDELWILTLPAFQWVLASGGHSGTRIGHTCHVVGQRQFLSIGGVNPSQLDKWSVPDTNNIQGLGTFDLTNLSWQSTYQAKAAQYQRSQLVQSVYNTNGIYPVHWTQPALRDLFIPGASSTSAPASSSPASPSTSPQPSTAPTNHPKASPPALIAGATVGSAVLLLLLGLLYYLYRRHRSYQRYGSDASLQGPTRHELSNTRATGRKPLKPPPSPIELPAGEIAAEKDAMTPPPVYSSPRDRRGHQR